MGSYEGNSEGSVYLGQDGNAYQVIDGKSVQVSKDRLIVAGSERFASTLTIEGTTFHHDINGNFFLVQNGQYVPISLADLQKLDAEKFGGQLEIRWEQELKKQQEKPNYALYVGIGLIVILLLRG
jgi:hypothetical protein